MKVNFKMLSKCKIVKVAVFISILSTIFIIYMGSKHSAHSKALVAPTKSHVSAASNVVKLIETEAAKWWPDPATIKTAMVDAQQLLELAMKIEGIPESKCCGCF